MKPSRGQFEEWLVQARAKKKQLDDDWKKLYSPKIECEYYENNVKVTRYEPVKSETPQYIRPNGKMRTYVVEHA